MSELFVGNLNPDTEVRDLENVFGRYGKIIRCDLKKNFAFIQLSDERGAKDAIKNENNSQLLGSTMTVEWAKGAPTRPVGPPGGFRGRGGRFGGRPPMRDRSPIGGGRPPRNRSPFGGGRPPMRDRSPFGGGRPPMRDRSPIGGGRPPKRDRSPFGGGRPPVRDRSPAFGGGRPPMRDRSPPPFTRPPMRNRSPMGRNGPPPRSNGLPPRDDRFGSRGGGRGGGRRFSGGRDNFDNPRFDGGGPSPRGGNRIDDFHSPKRFNDRGPPKYSPPNDRRRGPPSRDNFNDRPRQNFERRSSFGERRGGGRGGRGGPRRF